MTIIKKMKYTMRCYFTFIWMAVIKKRVSKNMEKFQLLYIVGGNGK